MDVTCGIIFSTDSSSMAQLECALLSSNFDDIKKYASKLKKKREISSTLEIVLECYVGIHRQIRLHAASLELDLSHLLAYQIKPEISVKLKDKLKKVLMMDVEGGSEFELKLAYVLLGLLGLFSYDGGKESLNDSLTYFDKIDFDLSKKFLLYELGDTEITQSSLIEKIFGVLGVYFRGVALELQGKKEDACDQYQVIIDFLFRFRVQQFTQSKSVYDFICAALYRSGCLLNQLAQFRESAGIFRSFLNFYQVNPQNQLRQPTNSTIRLLRALSQYMDLLDRKFRKYNFKTFCDEQQSINNSGNNNNLAVFRVENVQEEIILCCMLLESIEQSPLVKKTLEDLRLEGNVLRRFARIGYLEGITRIQNTRFQTSVANLEIYRNMFHSLMSAGKLDKAILSAKMYLQGNGKDSFTLLLICKLYLTLPTKIDESFMILDGINCEKLDIVMQIPLFLLRGKYFLIKSRKECSIAKELKEEYLKKSIEEFKLVLQVDENNAEVHFYLSLLAYETEDLETAEKQVKKSLSIDSSQIKAWNLFALIKSVKRDFESVLSICNTELSNMIHKDLNLSLLKVSTLMALNKSDEAIEMLKRIISAHFRKSNDLKMDGGMTVISEGTLGPGNFLSKFLGDLNGSIYDLSCDYGSGNDNDNDNGSNYHGNSLNLDILTGMEKLTTFQEYTESFPLTLNEFLSSKNCESEGVINVIQLEDLKIITNNSNNNITLLWIEVAKVYLKEGFLQDAEAAVSQAYQSDEIFSPIFATFALIEEAKNSLEEAEKFYRKGLSIDSEDETCLLGLSRVRLRSQNPSKLFEAESLIHRLIRIDPNIAESWSILAQCCFQTGRSEDALKYFEIALKKESTAPLRSIRSIPIN